MKIPEEICQTIERAENIVLLTHIHARKDPEALLNVLAVMAESYIRIVS